MRIEQTESRLRLVVAALVVSVSALSVAAFTHPAISQPSPQYLTVRRLTVVDDAGRRHIAPSTPGEEADAEIWTEAGVQGFDAHASRGAALVWLRQAPGDSIEMIADPGISAISMRASDERTNAGLGVLFDGPGLFLRDQGSTAFKVP